MNSIGSVLGVSYGTRRRLRDSKEIASVDIWKQPSEGQAESIDVCPWIGTQTRLRHIIWGIFVVATH